RKWACRPRSARTYRAGRGRHRRRLLHHSVGVFTAGDRGGGRVLSVPLATLRSVADVRRPKRAGVLNDTVVISAYDVNSESTGKPRADVGRGRERSSLDAAQIVTSGASAKAAADLSERDQR